MVAQGALTTFGFSCENRLVKITSSDGSIVTDTWSGDGLRRTTQQPGENVSTMIWDKDRNYLGQI